MYIVKTPQGEKIRKEHNLERARNYIAGTDNVIHYSKTARKLYLETIRAKAVERLTK